MTIVLTRPQLVERIARDVLGWEVLEEWAWKPRGVPPTAKNTHPIDTFDPTRSGSDLDLVIDSVKAPRWIVLEGPAPDWPGWRVQILAGAGRPVAIVEHASRHASVCLAVLSAHLGERVELEEES